jgi:hypothetical protein
MGAALLEEVEDMKAAEPARNGRSAVEGLAVRRISYWVAVRVVGGESRPRRAIEAADLVVDSILATETKEKV